MNNPTITISIKPHLADFCRNQFSIYKDYIVLSRTNPIGKMIMSQIITSDVPVKRPFKENQITFILPKITSYHLENKFLFVSKLGEEFISDYIQSIFDLEARAFFDVGYQNRFTQKEIIQGFITGYNLKNNAITFDMMKKNDQRKKRKFRKNVFETIQNVKKQYIKKFC